MSSLASDSLEDTVENVRPPGYGIERLRLDSFRNYAELDLDWSPSLNVLSGANAQGKTNLLEAIYLLSTTRLLRGMKEAEAILEGRDRATLNAELLNTHTSISMILQRGVRKRAQINSMNVPRAADLIGRLPCISVSTSDFPVVRGEPADRRLFLDVELSQLYPAYLRHLTVYKRAVDQRNALLKASQEAMQPSILFEPWEEQIAIEGAALRRMRSDFIDGLLPIAARLHGFMGSGEPLALRYEPRDEAIGPDELLMRLQSNREKDVYRGSTGTGPHRDELAIEVGDREARLFGSQGQQRTALISLKLAVLEFGTPVLGAPPVLLLDDILSDLDERRRALLVEIILQRTGQAILTCTEAAAAGQDILSRARVYEVRQGTVTEA